MAVQSTYDVVVVPRLALRFPIALPVPDGFDRERAATWPKIPGRLEHVGGKLEYMPPCGDVQRRVAVDVATELNVWRRAHPEFVVGGNEAGMLLGGDVRAADAAVWRSAERALPGFARTAPVLAVEIAGVDDTHDALRAKAAWYLGHGVGGVWIVLPEARRVEVITALGSTQVGSGEHLPPIAALPGLSPRVDDFFRQLG